MSTRRPVVLPTPLSAAGIDMKNRQLPNSALLAARQDPFGEVLLNPLR
jgi:hypothetical protein